MQKHMPVVGGRVQNEIQYGCYDFQLGSPPSFKQYMWSFQWRKNIPLNPTSECAARPDQIFPTVYIYYTYVTASWTKRLQAPYIPNKPYISSCSYRWWWIDEWMVLNFRVWVKPEAGVFNKNYCAATVWHWINYKRDSFNFFNWNFEGDTTWKQCSGDHNAS